jgi:hypothetical protein
MPAANGEVDRRAVMLVTVLGVMAGLLTATVGASAARGTAQTVNLPPVLSVDVGQRLISGAATGRTIKITSVHRDRGRLLISGAERSGIWVMAVVEDSGQMSSAVMPRDGGFLMFGKCSAS